MNALQTTGARTRDGVTLVELLVVLAVLGVMFGIAGVAFRNVHATPAATRTTFDDVAAARRQAIATGNGVSTTLVLDGHLRAVTAHADGRVLADSLPGIDPLSGRPVAHE
jgi:prepilin-type N-terminal cleavage/methylation domain-containing protein